MKIVSTHLSGEINVDDYILSLTITHSVEYSRPALYSILAKELIKRNIKSCDISIMSRGDESDIEITSGDDNENSEIEVCFIHMESIRDYWTEDNYFRYGEFMAYK